MYRYIKSSSETLPVRFDESKIRRLPKEFQKAAKEFLDTSDIRTYGVPVEIITQDADVVSVDEARGDFLIQDFIQEFGYEPGYIVTLTFECTTNQWYLAEYLHLKKPVAKELNLDFSCRAAIGENGDFIMFPKSFYPIAKEIYNFEYTLSRVAHGELKLYNSERDANRARKGK